MGRGKVLDKNACAKWAWPVELPYWRHGRAGVVAELALFPRALTFSVYDDDDDFTASPHN